MLASVGLRIGMRTKTLPKSWERERHEMKNILNRSDRNIAILDIEASALGPGSFPIEVGVALVCGPSEPIGVGAKLILSLIHI